MDVTKIKAAIEDLEAKESAIQMALSNMRLALKALGDAAPSGARLRPATAKKPAGGATNLVKGSYLDEAIRFLGEIEKPIHVNEITAAISERRNKPNLKRQSIESTLLRHIKSAGDHSIIQKFGPSIFGLRRSDDGGPDPTSRVVYVGPPISHK